MASHQLEVQHKNFAQEVVLIKAGTKLLGCPNFRILPIPRGYEKQSLLRYYQSYLELRATSRAMKQPYAISFRESSKDAEAADDPLPKESDFDLEQAAMFIRQNTLLAAAGACAEKLLPARTILYANFVYRSYPGKKVEDSAQTYSVCADCNKSCTRKVPIRREHRLYSRPSFAKHKQRKYSTCTISA